MARDKRFQMKKVEVKDNPWLYKCCWSCRNSDVSYDLSSLVCKRFNSKVSLNNICSLYLPNAKNPYQENAEKLVSGAVYSS